MFRTKLFWAGFVLASLLATAFSVRYFSTAFPLLSVDVRMDRDAALRAARELAQKNAWPPAEFDQAVVFGGEAEVQNFIELEGGGKAELARILRDGVYSPHKWTVRHFKEGDAHETHIRFTPAGMPYGFAVKLPEKEAGATMEAEAARALAQSTAERDWQVDFSLYDLAESSKEVRPGGRTDHTFVFERRDSRLGEGRYRLRLVVGGDKLTELAHFVKVPEGFSRRYTEMRATNDSVNTFASFAVLAYLVGFCGVGLFFMTRQRWVLWRQPVMWAALIAALTSADTINMGALAWMDYDTAVPASGFALQQAGAALGLFVLMTVLMSVSFMAAETLSRRAFPHHYQLWRVWSRPAAASPSVWRHTLTGYLLIGIFFAYEIAMYAFAHSRLGWWSPSDLLVDPNIFGAYLPTLSSVANSAQAGFWEESLFRAVPLAVAALIGDRFGKRRAFIVVMMVIQALVFGAGHAGYANQPAYARVVELIIPSFAFGALYVAFGLLPGVVLHYTYDLVWFAMPIFHSSSPRATFEQVLVILLGLLPIGVLVYQRLRSPSWVETPGEALNSAWTPPAADTEPSPPASAISEAYSREISPLVLRLLPVAGLAGLVAWATTLTFTSQAPPIVTNLRQAEAAARQAFAAEGVQFDASWRALPFIVSTPEEQHRFVWQRAGREKFDALLGTYLPVPRWNVRFARFEGDVAARAEEYVASISGEGKVLRTRHLIPEAAPGATLTVEEARASAKEYVIAKYHLATDKLEEVSAEASKKPARSDWDFIFRDTRDYGLPEGEARIGVTLAGNKVVYNTRYVHVPEDWAREERARRNIPGVFALASSLARLVLVLAGAVVAIVWWSRRRPFSVRALLAFLPLLFVLDGIGFINRWPEMGPQLQTAQPFLLQLAILASGAVIALLCGAGALAIVSGFVMGTAKAGPPMRGSKALLVGVAFGLALTGISAISGAATPPGGPEWSGFAEAGSLMPFLSAALLPLSGFLAQTLVLWMIFQWLRPVPGMVPAIPLIFIGLVVTGSTIEAVPAWLLSGVAVGIVLTAGYALLFRYQPELLPISMAAVMSLAALKDGFHQTYPAQLLGSIVASILIAASAWVWFRKVRRIDV